MDISRTAADDSPNLLRIFPGDSELAVRMRKFDWSSTDLGPPGMWPANLRIALSICLTSRFPILLWWGPNFTVLYNDAYIPFLGESKHPRYLGGAGRECWAEIWDVIGPMLEGVRSTGQATWSDAFATFFARKLPREEVYVRFTYSPILASDGRTVEGIFTPCTEITDEIIGARRLETLRRLGAHATGARTIAAACEAAARVFAESPDDIPFAAIYVGEDGGTAAVLQAAVYPDGEHRLPKQVTLADDGSPWPLRKVLADSGSEAVDLASLGLQLTGRRWPDTIRSALISPISAAQNRLSGILVFGTNPRRPLDSSYRTFFDLITHHVATAIADALGYQDERRRAEELAELDRAKTAFFSNISHEFRTPLTLMLGPLEDWEKQANGPVTVSREDLDLLHRNTRRLLRLVNSLLDFSRIEAGRMEASYEPTDLPQFTTELASSFQSAADKAGLRFTIVCPPITEPVYVDRTMWEKIVLNLVSNALKFTFEGEVAVALTPVGSHVELSVSDTGIGIPEQDLPRLFDRFYQVKGALGRTYEGSGIGLALVRDLAKLHSGDVRVESALGTGSLFTVSIPIGRAHLPVEHVRNSRRWLGSDARAQVEDAQTWMRVPVATSAARPPPGLPRVLIADDNFDMRKYMQRLLSGAYHVDEAADGETALAMALTRTPDLVISDVMMPRKDGFALLEALRRDARTERVPVILLSARAGEESHVEGLLAGADDYLVKPFSARELLARVSSRLDLARLRHEAADRESFIERIAELTPVVISVFDLASRRITYVSTDVAALLGYTSEEIREMEEPFAALAHPGDVSRYQQWLLVTGNAANGGIREIEHQLRRNDGEWRWFSSRLMLFSGNHVVSRQVVTATVDITTRKRSDQALRSSEERFRSIFELGLIGMAITSPGKGILAVNDEICRILGYERAEVLTKTWAELTHPDDLASDVALFDRVMAGEIDGYLLDKRWIRKDGRVVQSTISVKCVRDKDRAVDYFVALLQDITIRKEAEDVLARSHSELERGVVERTAQLTAINQELTAEIAQRQRAEAESAALKDALAADLAAMSRLHEFSTRLLQATETTALLDEVLCATINIQDANFGNVQLYNAETGALEILAHRGFDREFLDHFRSVPIDHGAVCSRALEGGQRVIVEDVLTDPAFGPHRAIAASAGFRAVQSTPIFGRRGDPLGMISTHFRQPHRPSDRQLRFTDLYARFAAELIERQRAEDALRISEGRFRELVRDLPAGVYTCDAAGYITYFNEAAAAIWGRRPDFQRDRWCGSLHVFSPAGEPVPLESCPMALALEGQPVEPGVELVFERPDGSRRNVVVYPEAIRDASGAVNGAVNMVLDITDYKVAQQALQRSEDRFRRYFELGLVGMSITSPEKAILEVNDEMCRVLGYERSELLQKTWPELTHPDDLAAEVAEFDRVVAGEIDGYSLDKRWIRKDGQVIESIVSKRFLRGADGSGGYFMGLLQDITQRKLVEEQLRRSEAYLAEGQRISLTGSWAVKLPSEEVFWSQEMFHIYGLDPGTRVLSQQRVFQLIHPDDRSFVEEAIRRAIRKKTDYDVHHRAIMPDGSFKYLHVLGHPLLNEAGEVTEYVGAVADITDRKRAEEALLNLRSELAYFARVTTMGELAAAIAHEVNQPLGAIANNASVAGKLAAAGSAAGLGDLRDVLSDIVSDSKRASSIIAHLRGLVKRVAPSRERLEISAIIRDVLAVAGREFAQRRIAVHLQLADNLPPVLGERVQCQQLILNLVMNAADAMHQTPVEKRALTIGARRSERDGQPVVLVTVRDIGCGFGAEDPERLFDALYTTKKDGMGMGLRISRSIAEAHGGHLWAEANEDVGATFFWSVPIAAKVKR
jgi:PAS domain S-box-containing protein